MRGLVAMLEPLRDGKVVELSQRKLARALGVGKSSVNRTLAELRAAGELIVETTAAGTRLALAG
jgi:DNA-binding transcriptional regulator LsrR (DeoR family)